jgi:hypothetical protein
MGVTRIESAVGPVNPPMTLPPGQEQERIPGELGLCDKRVAKGQKIGSCCGRADPPMTMPPGHEQELMSEGGAGVNNSAAEVA